LEIRAATPADAGAIAEVHVASWRSAYHGIVPDDWLAKLDVPRRTEQWEKLLGGTIVLVADDGGVVGFVAAHADTGEIAALYLAPDRMRAGIGTQLLDAVHDRLRAAGRTRARLWVFTANQPARAFYAAHGYAHDGTTDIVAGQPVMQLSAAL
jgi:GNAT superfamily N-acetyltransferase